MKIRRSIVQMLASRQCSLMLMAVNTVVLARLLTPADFGVFATALAMVAVAATAIEFGLPAFLIQSEHFDRRLAASALGLSLSISLGLAALLSPLLFLLPDSMVAPPMRWALALMAISLLAKPWVMVLEAELRRDLRFGFLSLLAVIRMAVQTSVAIALAAAGMGAAALASGVLAETLAALVILMAVAGRLTAPSVQGWRRMLRFGARYSTAEFLSKSANVLINLSISRILGFGLLGQLDRARTIVTLFDRALLDGIAPVVLPAFSAALRSGSDPGRLYVSKSGYLAALCWPIFAVIALLAEPLVAVVLGAQWSETVPAVRILSLMGLFLPFTRMSMDLFIALGMSREYLRLAFVNQTVRVLLAVGGALISFEAACLGISLSYGFKALLIMPALKAATNYRIRDLAVLSGRSAAIAASASAGPAVVLMLAGSLTTPWLLAALALAGLGWLLGAALTREPLLQEMLSLLHRLSSRSVSPS